MNDDKDAIRLDSLDGVGKEFVRRAIGRLISGTSASTPPRPKITSTKNRANGRSASRNSEPEDISAAIAYLVSDAAQYVTGVTFPVDAGFCNKL